MDTHTKEAEQMTEFFGFSDMSDDEKVAFLDTVGTTIFESALVRYLADANEEEVQKFQSFIEEKQEEDNAFDQITAQFPKFAELLFEESSAFREEVLGVAGATPTLST